MKFSQRTLQLLRNFSTIEESIMLRPGNVISTMSKGKSILAIAKIDNTIEKPFAVSEVGNFLSALSMFTDPELTQEENWVTMSEGSSKMNYVYSDPDCVVVAPDKPVNLPSIDVEFELKADVLTRITKALSIIDAPMIAIRGDNEKVYLETVDPKNPTKSVFSVEVGETDKTFRMIIAATNIKLITGDYTVEVCSRGYSHFKGVDIDYWIAMEATSTFEG